MRVLHLLDTTENYAGTEIHLTTLVKAQIRQGIRAEIALAEGGQLHRAAQAQSLPHFALPSGIRQQVRALSQMTREYNIVHAHNGRTRLLAALATQAPAAVVATQHFISTQSETYRGPKKWIANQAHRWVNQRMAHFIAISNAARDAMIEREGVDSRKITVIANGVEPIEAPDLGQKLELRRELGIAANAPLMVCVARLSAEKGLRFLIDAMPAVLAAHPQTRLLIAGEGELRGELETQAARLDVGAAIDFLGYRDDATRLIGSADVFVLPSPAEPFGLVLIEAMAQGVALIAARAGGPLEIVEDGTSGQLVNPSDALDLEAAIIELLSDSQKRAALGHHARQRFNERFTAERMAAATIEVYRRLTKS